MQKALELCESIVRRLAGPDGRVGTENELLEFKDIDAKTYLAWIELLEDHDNILDVLEKIRYEYDEIEQTLIVYKVPDPHEAFEAALAYIGIEALERWVNEKVPLGGGRLKVTSPGSAICPLDVRAGSRLYKCPDGGLTMYIDGSRYTATTPHIVLESGVGESYSRLRTSAHKWLRRNPKNTTDAVILVKTSEPTSQEQKYMGEFWPTFIEMWQRCDDPTLSQLPPDHEQRYFRPVEGDNWIERILHITVQTGEPETDPYPEQLFLPISLKHLLGRQLFQRLCNGDESRNSNFDICLERFVDELDRRILIHKLKMDRQATAQG